MTAAPAPPVLLVDTNVVLDVVLRRERWLAASAALLEAVVQGRATAFVAGHTLTTIHYITEKANGRAAANTAVADLLELCDVVPLARADFQRALAMGLADFEDAVQVAAALQIGADYLVSRNPQDFVGAPVGVRSPGELLPMLGSPRE